MEINYKFDDSKDEHKKGVKKNKFTKDRIHSYDTPEFDPSSGWPDEAYGKDFSRLDSDSPSFEGNYWFVSQNFNDVETNKRPLHPQKDYLNYEDSHTGDDHVEIRGNHKPTDKVPHNENPNSDHQNYDEEGKMFMDKKNGHHLMVTETVKDEIKHIYKENKNTMKSTMQEQLNRIKQMMLFEEGMSFKDVKSLTEQDKEAVVGPEVGVVADKVAVVSKGGEKNVDFDAAVVDVAAKEVPVEKGTPGEASKEVAKKEPAEEKPAEEKPAEEKPAEEKPVEKEPGKEPGKGEDTLLALRTLPLNEATGIKSGNNGAAGFPDKVDFTVGETNYSLVETESKAGLEQGDELGIAPNTISVVYYTLSQMGSSKETTSVISTKAGTDSEAFLTAMDSLNISFSTMSVPASGIKAPGGEFLDSPAGISKGAEAATPSEFSKLVVPQNRVVKSLYSAQAALDNPIQPSYGVEFADVANQGIVVYSFNSQESLDNATKAGKEAQNEAVATEVLRLTPQPPVRPGDPSEPVFGEIITATGGGNDYELDFGEDGRIFGTGFIKDLGTGKVTKGAKENQLLITFGKVTHGKYGKGQLTGDNGGRDDVFVLTFTTQDGDVANTAKVPFKVSKSKSFKSAPSKGMKRGSYQAPTFGTRLTSQQPTLNFGTSKSAYDPFSGGGSDMGNVSDLKTADLKSLIDQLQSQLDGDDNEDFDDEEMLNETYRRPNNYRRRPMNRRRLNESSIVSKVKEYGTELQDFAKRKGVPVDELKKGLEGLSTGAVNMSKEIAQAAGEFLGVLVANNEIPKSEVDGLEKNLKESIKRSKNVIKLTEGDLYKIVDRVLNEKKKL